MLDLVYFLEQPTKVSYKTEIIAKLKNIYFTHSLKFSQLFARLYPILKTKHSLFYSQFLIRSHTCLVTGKKGWTVDSLIGLHFS